MGASAYVDVKDCSACGANHDAMLFQWFRDSIDISGWNYNYIGECKATGEALYLRFNDDEQPVQPRLPYDAADTAPSTEVRD